MGTIAQIVMQRSRMRITHAAKAATLKVASLARARLIFSDLILFYFILFYVKKRNCNTLIYKHFFRPETFLKPLQCFLKPLQSFLKPLQCFQKTFLSLCKGIAKYCNLKEQPHIVFFVDFYLWWLYMGVTHEWNLTGFVKTPNLETGLVFFFASRLSLLISKWRWQMSWDCLYHYIYDT